MKSGKEMGPEKQLIQLYKRIDRKRKEIGNICKRHDNCCNSFFPQITYLEWLIIKRFLEEKKIDLADRLDSNLFCPFFKKHGCIIFPVRPLICRICGSASNFSFTDHRRHFLACKRVSIKDPSLFPFDTSDFLTQVFNLSLEVKKDMINPINHWVNINCV